MCPAGVSAGPLTATPVFDEAIARLHRSGPCSAAGTGASRDGRSLAGSDSEARPESLEEVRQAIQACAQAGTQGHARSTRSSRSLRFARCSRPTWRRWNEWRQRNSRSGGVCRTSWGYGFNGINGPDRRHRPSRDCTRIRGSKRSHRQLHHGANQRLYGNSGQTVSDHRHLLPHD